MKKLPNERFRLFLHQHLACTLKMVVKKAIQEKQRFNHQFKLNLFLVNSLPSF
jgi:hypothetical protein